MAKKFTTLIMHLLRWLTTICLASTALAESRFDIADFWAKSGGHTLNTAAINAAVKACHDASGGMVVVPPGTFVTGTIRLLDRVQLHLAAGAVLRGSTNLADYQLDGVRRGLIFAFEARDVALTGLGTIDGTPESPIEDLTLQKHSGEGLHEKCQQKCQQKPS